jgi:hypothetical protein
VVTQAEAVDLPLPVADTDRAAALDELLIVTLGELLPRSFVWLLGLASEHARSALTAKGQAHLGLRVRIVPEGGSGVGHLLGIVEQQNLAGVLDPQLLEGGSQ